MRITGGQCRGRSISPPRGLSYIRPTCDRVREAIFNILGPKVHGANVLDCFAGTGALGIEALSRGANHAVFIDRSRRSLELITHNLLLCFPKPRALCILHKLDAQTRLRSLRKQMPPAIAFDLIFLDPPYGNRLIPPVLSLIEQGNLLADKGVIVVEEHGKTQLPETPSQLRMFDHRTYGETGIWLYNANSRVAE